MYNVLSLDLEEYFHASEMQSPGSRNNWSALPSRIEAQTDWVLNILAEREVRCTFFVLGWVAERHSRLIRRISEAGHEIACHGYAHELVYKLTPPQFREDILRARRAIEDACGLSPAAYRAPSYSIIQRSMWALEVLVECGFSHDSSIYPIVHDRYGIPGFGRHAQMVNTASGPIYEVPIATVNLSSGRVVPVGGGAYLRLLPYRYTAAGIRRVNRQEGQPACIYFHPWEIDADLPRLHTGWIARLRTYGGLSTMRGKLLRLLADFQFSTLASVHRLEAPEVPSIKQTVSCLLGGAGLQVPNASSLS